MLDSELRIQGMWKVFESDVGVTGEGIFKFLEVRQSEQKVASVSHPENQLTGILRHVIGGCSSRSHFILVEVHTMVSYIAAFH